MTRIAVEFSDDEVVAVIDDEARRAGVSFGDYVRHAAFAWALAAGVSRDDAVAAAPTADRVRSVLAASAAVVSETKALIAEVQQTQRRITRRSPGT